MSDLLHLSVRESRSAELRGTLEGIPLLSRLRKELASNRPTWLPLVLVLAAIAVVAYADHLVVSLSLVYLYTLPLTVGAIFLRKEISYGLIVACILFHYFFHYFDFPRHIHLGLRIFHDLSALLCLTLVVYVIQRYIERQESLVKAVQQQRAALLMSATAAALRLEANHDRNMLEQVERLNAEIGAVSDPERYVTLLLAEIDTRKLVIQYVNCGHNPALLFRPNAGTLTRLNSSCPPIGLSPEEMCELTSVDLLAGDVLVFYTDGVTEAENRLGEEFGMERLSATVRRGSSLSAEDLMRDIHNAAADFCGDDFNDDVTILIVKCDFNGSLTLAS